MTSVKILSFLLPKGKFSIFNLFSPCYVKGTFKFIWKTAKDRMINNVTAVPN